MTWRESAIRVIEKVIDQYGTTDPKELKKKLFEAYPFGQREHYPYKVWCEEVKKRIAIYNQRPVNTVLFENE